MLKIGSLILAGSIAVSLASAARADSSTEGIKLGRFITKPTSSASTYRLQSDVNPFSHLSVHAGPMFLPNGAFDVGADLTVPNWTLGEGWVPRFDVDVLIGADVDGTETPVSVTANLVNFYPNAVGSRSLYFGGGIGVFFAEDEDFQAKLILGMPITDQLSVELNTHFVPGTVAWTILARFHL